MIEEKISLENEIYEMCDEIEKKHNKNIKKIKSVIDEDKITFTTKKILKIKRYIYNSELLFELNSDKDILKDKLNMILTAENTIDEVLKDDPNNNSEINERINSIVNTIKEIDTVINSLVDYSLYMNRDGIKNNIQLYKRELNNVSNEINDLKSKLSSDFQIIKENVDSELQQLTDKQNDINNNINTKSNDFEQKITELQEIINQKNSDIEAIKENYNNELENIKKIYEDEIYNLKQQANQDFDNIKSDIEKKNEKISKLIGLIGNKANVGEYKTNADKAHKERIVWQIATVAIFVVALVLMALITFLTKDYNIATLARYIVSVILLGMSGYTAKQASNQRKDEIYFRKQQLELLSMDVYLDDMPDNIKQEVKQSLSNKIFGQARETYKNKYDESANNSIEKLAGLIQDLLHRQK